MITKEKKHYIVQTLQTSVLTVPLRHRTPKSQVSYTVPITVIRPPRSGPEHQEVQPLFPEVWLLREVQIGAQGSKRRRRELCRQSAVLITATWRKPVRNRAAAADCTAISVLDTKIYTCLPNFHSIVSLNKSNFQIQFHNLFFRWPTAISPVFNFIETHLNSTETEHF